MESVRRVRIICLDKDGHVLLMQWRDPVDGHTFWEPPGGGIEPGESPHDAAIRELFEETGLRPEIATKYIVVPRDYIWAGKHYVHDEGFFLTRVDCAAIVPGALTPGELTTFVAAQFVTLHELGKLHEPLEPLELNAVINRLCSAVHIANGSPCQ